MNRKVTVVGGAGNVGATAARCIADKGLADVVIVDIADNVRVRVLRSTITSVLAKPDPAAAREAAKQKTEARAKVGTKE